MGPITNLTNVNGYIGVFRSRSDGKLFFFNGQDNVQDELLITHRMPLPSGNFGDLNEEPLACCVLETGFDDTEFHSPTRVNENLGQPCCPPGTILPVHPFSKVRNSRPDSEPPALIAKAVLRRIERERADVVWICRITDETTSSVCVKADEEEERKVMSVPESFETLVAYLVVCSGIHENHDQEHKMTSDATRLCVMDLQCILRADL
jgi:hypothetical protein